MTVATTVLLSVQSGRTRHKKQIYSRMKAVTLFNSLGFGTREPTGRTYFLLVMR
jgi:hypothetical protein